MQTSPTRGWSRGPRGQGRRRQTRDTRGELVGAGARGGGGRGHGTLGTRPGLWARAGGEEARKRGRGTGARRLEGRTRARRPGRSSFSGVAWPSRQLPAWRCDSAGDGPGRGHGSLGCGTPNCCCWKPLGRGAEPGAGTAAGAARGGLERVGRREDGAVGAPGARPRGSRRSGHLPSAPAFTPSPSPLCAPAPPPPSPLLLPLPGAREPSPLTPTSPRGL